MLEEVPPLRLMQSPSRSTDVFRQFVPAVQSALSTPRRGTRKAAGPQGVLEDIRTGLLQKEVPPLGRGEGVQVGTLRMKIPLEVLAKGACSKPLVMPVEVLEEIEGHRLAIRTAVVPGPAA
eukprot:jgi/Undpi1/7806/HiC_scaffold_23.g10279.m1